jgi:AraC-like DNA-binding protein
MASHESTRSPAGPGAGQVPAAANAAQVSRRSHAEPPPERQAAGQASTRAGRAPAPARGGRARATADGERARAAADADRAPTPTPAAAEAGARLAAAIRARTPEPGVHATAHPGLHVVRRDAPGRLAQVVYEPCLCVVAQGAKIALLQDAGEEMRYDALHYLVLSVPLPLACRIVEASAARPFLALRLAVDPVHAGEVLAEVDPLAAAPPAERGDGGPGERRAGGGRGAFVSPIAPALLDALARLLGALDDPASRAVLAPMAEREVLFHVLRGEQAHLLRAAAQQDQPIARVAAVIRHLRRHLAAQHDVADLARRAAMSPSAFHAHFRAVTAESPLQFLKKLRLHGARGLMLYGGLGAAEASARVGYNSPSQFSREFRRLFGASPREEVERARAEGT